MAWNVVIVFLLFYACVVVPVQVSYWAFDVTHAMGGSKFISVVADLLFMMDIGVNFFTAYEVPGSKTFEVRPMILAKDYLSSWFFVDVIAALPVDITSLFVHAASTDKAGLSSVYINLRLIRLFKLVKLSKYNKEFSNLIARFKFSAGT